MTAPLKSPRAAADNLTMTRGGRRPGAGRPSESLGARKSLKLPESLWSWLGADLLGSDRRSRGQVLREAVDADRKSPAPLVDPGSGPSLVNYALTEPQRAHVVARAKEEGLTFPATLRAILEARRG